MQIECEDCGSERLVLTIHEIRMGRGKVVYSAFKCKSCGMVYPLQELAKGVGMSMSKDSVIAMLKQ